MEICFLLYENCENVKLEQEQTFYFHFPNKKIGICWRDRNGKFIAASRTKRMWIYVKFAGSVENSTALKFFINYFKSKV